MIAQILIAIFGVTAVWLSQDEQVSRRKYACLFGLAGQPAWFYAAWTTEQWGIFALCFLYSFSWLRGFRQYWMDGRGLRFKPKIDPALTADIEREMIVQSSIDRMNEIYSRKEGRSCH